MIPIRILIVADDPLARAGLAALLSDQPDIEVVGQTAVDTLPGTLDIFRSEVIVWDVGWGEAPEALSTLQATLHDSEPAVLVLLPDTTHVVDVWKMGARGILLRDASIEQLAAALAAIAQRIIVLDPALSGALRIAPEPSTDRHSPQAELTRREMDVLQLLAEGLPNKTIARQLTISEHTVKFHINALMIKLDAQSRTDAVVRATRQGLLIL